VYAVFSKTYENDTPSARLLLEPKQQNMMAGSFVIKLMAVLLSVVCLSAATVSAAEIPVPYDSGRTCLDDAAELALVGYQVLLPLYRAEAYLPCEERETFHQPLPIFRHTYRGPPTLF
jgi:hypothetical protein